MAEKMLPNGHSLPSLSLVLGYIAVKELGRLEDRVRILTRLGYGISEMARICDATVRQIKAFNHKT